MDDGLSVALANTAPVADPDEPYAGVVGVPVLFDGTGSSDPDGDPLSYEWDFGDGSLPLSDTPTPSHTYFVADVYSVKLTVADPFGGTAEAFTTVTILPVATIETCNIACIDQDEFLPSEDVYVYAGMGYEGETSYNIYVVNDVTTWTDGMAIPPRVSGTATSVTTDPSGALPPALVWAAPLIPGKYDIVVDVNSNGVYDEGVDALDDMDVNLAGFFVVPEYPLGTILGVAMCFAALAVFKSKSLRIHL